MLQCKTFSTDTMRPTRMSSLDMSTGFSDPAAIQREVEKTREIEEGKEQNERKRGSKGKWLQSVASSSSFAYLLLLQDKQSFWSSEIRGPKRMPYEWAPRATVYTYIRKIPKAAMQHRGGWYCCNLDKVACHCTL